MKYKNYLSTNEKFDYLIDHCKTTLYTYVEASKDQANEFKSVTLTFKKEGIIFKSWINKRGPNLPPLIFVKLDINFNFNRAIMEEFAEIEQRLKRQQVMKESNNVIPSEVRHYMAEEGYSLSDIRMIGIKKFHAHIEQKKRRLSFLIREKISSSISWSPDWFKWTIQEIEICYDLLTNPGHEIAKNELVRRNFNDLVDEFTQDSFFKDGKSFAQCEYHETDTWGGKGDMTTAYLKGLIKTDKSIVKIYHKEQSRSASINRFERRFQGRNCFKKYFSGNTLTDRRDFENKVGYLANLTFQVAIKILSTYNPSLKKGNRKLLKEACRNFGGNKYWEIIYRLLTQDGCIYTGKIGSADKRLVPRVREMHKLGLLRKKQAGVYVVNWSFLLKGGGVMHKNSESQKSRTVNKS